ncbi:PrgI family protein [Candidatus Woesebacteria bacterium]|nr:PrgI family protein [Candidatus Woesebacteria bacterium]
MDQHPIPRQITSFEFKLIGFMTLKQFLYLVIFLPIGYIVFKVIPIPIINLVAGVLISGVGLAFAFIPIQDRPMEVWLRNLIKRLNSPTQYRYKKANNPLGFLNDLYFASDPHMALSHVDTKEKLKTYLATQQAQNKPDTTHDTHRKKQEIHVVDLLDQTKNTDPKSIKKGEVPVSSTSPDDSKRVQNEVKQPFVTGIVKNRRNIALPGVLVTISSLEGEQLRLLKTNPHGIFATYSPLPDGEYRFEARDPNGNYFFDTMNIHVAEKQQSPILLYSKEIL